LPVEETFQAVFALDVTLGDGDFAYRSHHTIQNLGTGKPRSQPYCQEHE
jgi:hypothetical protein